MTISILTLFPEMFVGPFSHSIVKNAVRKGLIDINFVNIRNFGIGKHKIVDDKPYGGGKGMILRVDVLYKAIEYAKKSFKKKNPKQKVILMEPSGIKYSQKKAAEYSGLDHLIIVCGRYEGFDARIKKFTNEQISIGDYILTGGEIPAMVITDSVTRLKKGVISKEASSIESFSNENDSKTLLEYHQYTRPDKFKNISVPKILLSGDHKKIEEWRKSSSFNITKKNRPDLLSSKG